MIHEIVYTESRSQADRSFLVDMTLLAHQTNGATCAVLSEVHCELHAVSLRRGVEVSKVLFSEPSSASKFSSFILTSLGFGNGQCASAYSESLSVSGSVASLQGESEFVGLLSVRNAEGSEVDARSWKHWDRARVAGWVSNAMAEHGVSL